MPSIHLDPTGQIILLHNGIHFPYSQIKPLEHLIALHLSIHLLAEHIYWSLQSESAKQVGYIGIHLPF